MKGFGYLFKEGLKNVWHNRMMSFASIGVLISCLLLTGAAVLVCMNVQSVVASVGDSNVVNVYLDDDINELEAKEIGSEIEKNGNVEKCDFYSKEVAILEFQDALGEVFPQMQGDQNPLPHAFHVSFKDLSIYDQTAKEIQQIDGVDKISNRSDVAEKLTSLNNLVATMGLWVVIILGIISLFIISNTIRMTMYARRFEISIMKSVGATNAFVRIPFVVEGMLIGLLSGLVSSVLLMFLYDAIMAAAQHIVPFTSIDYNVVAAPVTAAFAIAGMLVGAVGGFISIRKYLKKEGNEILGW